MILVLLNPVSRKLMNFYCMMQYELMKAEFY